ncbi:hypothetical protein GOV04_03645 [Candidatus Woesearchaeota archaeon]|nr:hypothetical protein [Candidatus Woesearchaeota archaeon]
MKPLFKDKKGQAAMEFMMTYGWAILALLTSVGVLAYLGVLDPARYMNPTCVMEAGIGCVDFDINSEKAQFFLVNNIGQDLTIISINFSDCGATYNYKFPLYDEHIFIIDCVIPKDKFKEEVFVRYISVQGLLKVHTGEIKAFIH